MVGSALLALASILVQRRAPEATPRPAAGIGEGIRTTWDRLPRRSVE